LGDEILAFSVESHHELDDRHVEDGMKRAREARFETLHTHEANWRRQTEWTVLHCDRGCYKLEV
jgi:hypothetical protein